MASRTDGAVAKTQVVSGLSWRLEFKGTRELGPLRLQKWRVVGDGRTSREQIRDHVTSQKTTVLQEEEKEMVPSQEEFVRPSPTREVEDAFVEDRGQSSGTVHSIVEEGETMISPTTGGLSESPKSPSSESEFNYADGYISGQEEIESEKEDVEDDDVQLTIKDAHSFKIFEDEENREPTSILDLDFDSEKCHRPNTALHLMGCTSAESSGLFMRTIDSWNIRPDGERNLKLFVRDTKGGSWIKLWKHSKEYELSVRDALIIIKFLDLAMRSKESDAKKFLGQLVERVGSWRAEVKRVLLKYYSSVVEKFVQSEKAPPILRKAPIIKNMASLLRGTLKKWKLEKEKLIAPVKRPSSIDQRKLESSSTPGAQAPGNKRRRIEESNPETVPEEVVHRERKKTAPDLEILPEEGVQKERQKAGPTMPPLNKRKRVVESDTENDSDSEDDVPLAQRQFPFLEKPQTIKSDPKVEQKDNALKGEKLDAKRESRKQGQDGGTFADLLLSPASNKDGGFLRSDEGGVDSEGEHDYLHIAGIYGGHSEGIGEIENGDDDDDDELGESAFCAICDDGGDLLLCDGPCMRSFHACKESASQSGSKCTSLGYKTEEVKEMASWLCENCVHDQHQCFICGDLGKSDGDDKEVFVCDVALCGRFYHPTCLAKWKTQEIFNGITDEDAFIQAVKEGVEEFCCPAHKCRKCGEGEEEGGVDNSMKLAKCRRCPKAYHKLCLPKKISFEGIGNEPVRAWEIGNEDDPMKRLVMYCLKHPIVGSLSTPLRNHLKWPKDSSSRQNGGHKDSLYGIQRMSPPVQKQQKLSKSSSSRQIPVSADDVEVIHQKYLKGTKGSLKQKIVHKDLNVGERNPSHKPDMGSGFSVAARKDRSTTHMPKRDLPVPALTPLTNPSSKHVNVPKRPDLQKKNIFVAKKIPTSREGREDRVLDIIRRASQHVTLETVKKTLVQPTCYADNRKKNFLHKGELQSMLNAIRKAAEKFKNGGRPEDAKRLCPKDKFIQMLKTAIVNRIHPYIDSGDMIVDFCCGANDFSIILRDKLLSSGKTCHFKNFDIHPPKNDFCFTKGDWLKNPGHGFLDGKKLIMGLNPPFGVHAQLANLFILHALKFQPKLLVLIVPPEAMSFTNDYKKFNYELVWEDKQLLQGHAFYLPGSVDDNDRENLTQWNKVPPPLYLWSHRDMIKKHQEIAVQCGHIEGLKADPLVLPNRRTPTPPLPARELSGLKMPSDKWTNSGSIPTECDTSSSRHQYSSTTSSANSLDGPGPCLPAGGHHASFQNPSWRGQTSGEQTSERLLIHLKRTSFGHGSVGHAPAPLAGPPQNNHAPILPRQQPNPGPNHSNLEQNPAPGVLSSPHLNHLNQLSPRGNEVQWVGPASQIPHRLQTVEPQIFQNPRAGQQPWRVRSPPITPNHHINHGFPQHPIPGRGPPQSWQPPQPHFLGHSLLSANSLQGQRGYPQGQPFAPSLPYPPPPGYFIGQAQLERRPGFNQDGIDRGSGGWLV